MGHIEKRQQKRPDGSLGPVRYRARYPGLGGRERSQTFSRKKDAEAFLTKISHSLLTGSYVDPRAGRSTLKEFTENWRKLQIHRDATANLVEQHLRLHVYPLIGDRPIASIRPSEIQGMVHRLGQTLAPSTVAVIYGRVVAAFRAAVRDRIITTSPCVDIGLPSQKPSSTLQVLHTEQVMGIADAIQARYRGLIITGAGTGLRPGELFGVTQSRVDFLRKSYVVDQQLVRLKPNRLVLGPPKTDASYRTLPLPESVLDALASHLAEWPSEHEWGLVFTNTEGGPIQEHTFASAWAVARSRARVPDWATPKALRHYYASVLIRSGASVKVVQARLGHSSAKTTLDVYGHLFADEDDRTRATIDAEFGSLTACRRPEARFRGSPGRRRSRSRPCSALDIVVEHEASEASVLTAPGGKSAGPKGGLSGLARPKRRQNAPVLDANLDATGQTTGGVRITSSRRPVVLTREPDGRKSL
jgi:integrase